MIQASSNYSDDPGDADNKETLVVMAQFTIPLKVATFQELCAATVKIGLQDIGGNQKACGDHKAKRWNRERPNVEERNHRWRSASPSKVYTRVRCHPPANLAFILCCIRRSGRFFMRSRPDFATAIAIQERPKYRMLPIRRAKNARGIWVELSSGKAARRRP